MRNTELLKEKYITCDLIEKCLRKVQQAYPAVRMQKFNDNKILWFEMSNLGRKVGSLVRNKEGQLEFTIG